MEGWGDWVSEKNELKEGRRETGLAEIFSYQKRMNWKLAQGEGGATGDTVSEKNELKAGFAFCKRESIACIRKEWIESWVQV